jgi:hypothetical protein
MKSSLRAIIITPAGGGAATFGVAQSPRAVGDERHWPVVDGIANRDRATGCAPPLAVVAKNGTTPAPGEFAATATRCWLEGRLPNPAAWPRRLTNTVVSCNWFIALF